MQPSPLTISWIKKKKSSEPETLFVFSSHFAFLSPWKPLFSFLGKLDASWWWKCSTFVFFFCVWRISFNSLLPLFIQAMVCVRIYPRSKPKMFPCFVSPAPVGGRGLSLHLGSPEQPCCERGCRQYLRRVFLPGHLSISLTCYARCLLCGHLSTKTHTPLPLLEPSPFPQASPRLPLQVFSSCLL